MFLQIAKFEYDFQRQSPVFWVTAILFFLLTFGSMTVDLVQIGSGGNVNANSPYAISATHMLWSTFFMFASTAFVANVVVRDDETQFGPILRSTRITKFDYLIGRFAGAFAAGALVFATVPAALWLGSLMPWLDQETLGPNRLTDYAYSYFVLGLPTIFTISAVFFALATMTRSMMWTYLGVVLFLILYVVGASLAAQQPQLETALSYADPFGATAYEIATEYWTSADRNAGNPALAGALLWNRLLWTGIGFAFLASAYKIYRFADKGISIRREKKQRLIEAQSAAEAAPTCNLAPLPRPAFTSNSAWTQLITRTKFEMRQIFKSPAYVVLLLLALFLVFFSLWFSTEIYGTASYPRTVAILPPLTGSFGFISIIIAIYYAGEVVWRERERKIHEIIDATPIPNWAYLVPKTLGVILVLMSTLAVGAMVGIGVQLARGHTDISLWDYVILFLLPQGVSLSLTAILAVFIQALSPNKYAGWGIMVLYMISNMVLSRMGFEHVLYRYGATIPAPLSDLNGSGGFLAAGWWLRLYWAGFALVMLVMAHLFWRRGTEQRLKPRLKQLPRKLKGMPGLIALSGLVVATSAGAFIYHNTNVLNEYQTAIDFEKRQADYEKKYLKYETLRQPLVTDVKLNVALYPEQTRADITGEYRLKNHESTPITEIHIRNLDPRLRVKEVNIEGARLASHDEEFDYRIFELVSPMQPGDIRTLRFETQRWQRGFRNTGYDTKLVRNGTFLPNYEITPLIGMDRRGLLQDRAKRRKYNLPADLRPAKLEDLSATKRNNLADWTTAQITVSTSADQTPIAPGKKVSDVTAGGRRTARFISDVPIMNFFSIQSARYAKRHRKVEGVDLTVFYHPAHSWNVDRILNSMERSLSYYRTAFGPYQFDQARVIEFPGYQTFAQAFANTMPYSESFGFAGDFRDPEDIDYATYVTAHELAHQYWGHQIAAADMQGATVLVETLAQYSALMVMKQIYGEDAIRRFLKHELDMYLGARATEAVEEVPLVRVENQQYIHYRKGSVAMYLLQERLGEDAVNRALRSLLNKYKFKGAPYPRSVDLIQALRGEARTPQHQALITDLFEKIALYDLKADEAKVTKLPNGKWQVTLSVEARKFYADGKGKETETPLAESIEVGLFTAEPGRNAFDKTNVIRMKPQPIRSGRQVLKFVTDKKPTHAGVDPYNFYIDRKSDDNVISVS